MSVRSRIEADYLIETALDPRAAEEAMAGEQSSGTFVPVPGETPELKARAAARVEALELLGTVPEPTLPGARRPQGAASAWRRPSRKYRSTPTSNGWGALSRHPALGWSYIAWQRVWHLAGADHMQVNGLANKSAEDDDSVIASAHACLSPLFDDKPYLAMPVFSSGQSARQALGTFAALSEAA